MRTNQTRLPDLIQAANDPAPLDPYAVTGDECHYLEFDAMLDDCRPAQAGGFLRGIGFGLLCYGLIAFAGLIADYYGLIAL